MVLNEFGEIAAAKWFESANHRRSICLDRREFVVMPNHVHGIVRINEMETDPSNGAASLRHYSKSVTDMPYALEQEINQLHAEICAGLADPKRILILYALHEKPRNINELVELLDLRPAPYFFFNSLITLSAASLPVMIDIGRPAGLYVH
jgi:hypothetical protein